MRRAILQQASDGGGGATSDGIQEDTQHSFPQSFDTGSNFTPSMAIILVVLLSAFFFMAFFSIYVRRCTESDDDDGFGRRRRIRQSQEQEQEHQQRSRGLEPSLLRLLPLISYSASKKGASAAAVTECVVCLTDFVDREPLKQLPKCQHLFHQDCIDMWLFSHTTCPLCRRSLLDNGLVRSPGAAAAAVIITSPPRHVTPPESTTPPPPRRLGRSLRRSYSTGNNDLRSFEAPSDSGGVSRAFPACFFGTPSRGLPLRRSLTPPPPPPAIRRSRSSAAAFRYYPISGSLPLRRFKLSPLVRPPV